MYKKPLLHCGIMILALSISLQAEIIRVPGDYPTIQAGINAGSVGDTVQVAAGTYFENIQMAEGVSLFGSGMDNTIIDGGGLNDVIKALNINNFVIQDFTIQNSRQDGSTPGNVGIFINPTSSSGTRSISRCLVRHNGHGIDIWNDFGGTSTIAHNVITDNLYDGFSPYLGTVYLTNNTITGNGGNGYYDWSGGGANYISNNIITGNGNYGILKHQNTPVYISYNDVWNNALGQYYQGSSGPYVPFDPYPGTGEISADPLFVDPGTGDFHLQAGSPCVDAGDPESPVDPDSTIADMGAFYFDQTVGIKDGETLPRTYRLIGNYPNPFNSATTIVFELPAAAFVTIDAFSITGQKIGTLLSQVMQTGRHQVEFNASELASGVYFYRLQAGDYSECRRMIYIK